MSNLKVCKKAHKGLLPSGYKPELDVRDGCDAEHQSRHQHIIEILIQVVELSQINIQVEVAIMSQYQAYAQQGHLEALYLNFCFLWNGNYGKQPKF